jgi:nucleoside-diphosphate-sugar epimerase
MTVLVVGATGATGRLVVAELLRRGVAVRAMVRSVGRLPEDVRAHPRLEVIEAAVLEARDDELVRHVDGCSAVVSCLGHTLSLRGIFGPPRRLVRDATRRLCTAIRSTRPPRPVRFVLMGSAGVRDHAAGERVSVAERALSAVVRVFVPPQPDNEQAAAHLRRLAHADPAIEWVVVRPDTLIDRPKVTSYELHASPIRSAYFDPGKTSRINVAHFMAGLVLDDALWAEWKGRMPVVYNRVDV